MRNFSNPSLSLKKMPALALIVFFLALTWSVGVKAEDEESIQSSQDSTSSQDYDEYDGPSCLKVCESDGEDPMYCREACVHIASVDFKSFLANKCTF